jgi:mevalonate kinase
MSSVSYRSPAKTILSGEHAVVYGKPALIVGLARYCTATVSEADSVSFDGFAAPVIDTVTAHLKKRGLEELRPYAVTFDTEIPVGRGLGSSAAAAVSLTAALLHFQTGDVPERELVNSLAYTAEKKYHGNPSGADNTACCYGGLIFFRKEFEFLKTISALNFKLPTAIEDQLYLIDTGKPAETTAEMVKGVSSMYNTHPEATDTLLSHVEKTTKRMVVSVVKEDAAFFRDCIVENQRALEELGVVSESARGLIRDLSPFGTGKVTGAGGRTAGSGFVLFYADEPEAFEARLKEKTIPYFKFAQDHAGVTAV